MEEIKEMSETRKQALDAAKKLQNLIADIIPSINNIEKLNEINDDMKELLDDVHKMIDENKKNIK